MEKETEYRILLENNLLSGVIKLFAILAEIVVDKGEVFKKEKIYVKNFFEKLYAQRIAEYLSRYFEELVGKNIEHEEVVRELNENSSYEEKLFILMKTVEFITYSEIEELQIRLVEKISRLMGVDENDMKFIFCIYNKKCDINKDNIGKSIRYLYICGDREKAEVYFENNNLDIEIYNINDNYYILNRSTQSYIYLEDYFLESNFLTKIHENQELLIENYRAQYDTKNDDIDYVHNVDIVTEKYKINFENIKFYFETKYSRLGNIHKKVYINVKENSVLINDIKDEDTIAELEIIGLKNIIKPLDRNVNIILNEKKISDECYVNINDVLMINGADLTLKKIIFAQLIDEIKIQNGKYIYTISNETSADIYIKDITKDKWNAKLIIADEKVVFEKGNCPYKVYNGKKEMKNKESFGLDDIIYINKSILKIDWEKRVIKKSILSFKNFVAKDIEYHFDNKNTAIDTMSFEAEQGDMIAIMGPSGSGKSTLINIMNGNYFPDSGDLLVNFLGMKENYNSIKNYIGYVPQEDLLFENLTVYENLYYSAKLRFPYMLSEKIDKLISNVLKDIDLVEKKNSIVGNPLRKILSGGERKRLNIGLELLSDAEIFFIDEPTSGLSSSDAEKIVDVLKRIAVKGKIVFVAIHQPSSKIYQNFDKVILLDKGGKLAYFGDVYSAVDYFKVATGLMKSTTEDTAELDPDMLLKVLEEPLKNIDGTSLNVRKYTPEEWKERYRRYIQDEVKLKIELEKFEKLPGASIKHSSGIRQFLVLFSRNFKNKLRNNSNLLITFIEAPLLALLTSFILRYDNNNEKYTLYSNSQIKTFIFVTVIITLFLAVTNSISEIISDRHILLREKFFNIKNKSYFFSKLVTLLIFAFVQNLLYIVISFGILEMKELHWAYIAFLTFISLCGITLGLFISSIKIISEKAALNIVPLLLIPQIILGGSLLKYEDMNRQLTNFKKISIPNIAQAMPSRWAYEALIILQDVYNSYSSSFNRLSDSISKLSDEKEKYSENDSKYDVIEKEIVKLKEEKEKLKLENMEKYGNSDIEEYVRTTNENYNMSIEELNKNREEIYAIGKKYGIDLIAKKTQENQDYLCISELRKRIMNNKIKLALEQVDMYKYTKDIVKELKDIEKSKLNLLSIQYSGFLKSFKIEGIHLNDYDSIKKKISSEIVSNNQKQGSKYTTEIEKMILAENEFFTYMLESKKISEGSIFNKSEKIMEFFNRNKELKDDGEKLFEFNDTLDKLERYPLFVKTKRIPIINVACTTVVYNSVILTIFSILFSFMTLLMLKFEKYSLIILEILGIGLALYYVQGLGLF